MFKKIRSIRKMEKSLETKTLQALEDAANSGGVVDIKIPNSYSPIVPFSYGNNYALDPNLTDYIEKNVLTLPIKGRLTLRMHHQMNFDENTREIIRRAFVSHYDNKLTHITQHKIFNRWKGFFCIIAAIVVFAIVVLLDHYNQNQILFESISVVAWVFMWEATDIMIFANASTRKNIFLNYRLKTANIQFIQED